MPTPASAPLSRRQLLGGMLAGGAAATAAPLLAAGDAAAAQTASSAAAPRRARIDATSFFADGNLNFQALFSLAAAGYGASETGEVLSTFNRIHARGDTYAAFGEEFLREGRNLRERGDAAQRRGDAVTARACFLRAAMYIDQALFFVVATKTPTRAREGRLYREMEQSFALAAALSRPRWEQVRIPYGATTLPGWLLTPGGRARRPTVILNNGSDAQNVDMFVYGGAAALERGWNALIFEGPGQGANLFLRDMPFRPDWEKVITPVVDFLRGRPEVDRRRIALFGQSFGGYLVMRAAAFEHRLAAVVPDPGVFDAFASWEASFPRPLLELLYAGRRAEFDGYWAQGRRQLSASERFVVDKRSEIYGAGSLFDKLTLARRFALTDELVRAVRAPAAVLSPEGEQFFPGQPQHVYRLLREDPKTLLRFTAAEGANLHCEPMAPQLRNERVFDWVEANMRPVG